MKKRVILSLVCICFAFLGCFLFSACGKKSLSLTLDYGGGMMRSVSCSSGDEFPSDPEKEDYIFGGWFEDENFEFPFDKENIENYLSQKKMTLHAKWIKKVTLVFSAGDLELDDIFLSGLDITLPSPEKEGYTFGGWFIDENLRKPYTVTSVVYPNSDNEVFLYPKWIASSGNKTIYYVAENVNLKKTTEAVKPSAIATLYEPKINFYEFGGWFFDREMTKPAPKRLAGYQIEGNDITLYGKFTLKEVESIKLLGTPRTLYNYGESFDPQDAKLFVRYVDKKYSDELLDITEDMLSGFRTKSFFHLVTLSPIFPEPEPTPMPEGYDERRNFYIIAADSEGNIMAQTDFIEYFIKSDISTLTLSEDDFTFNFGENNSIRGRGLSINWVNTSGEEGTLSVDDVYVFVYNLRTDIVGQSTFTVEYRFKKIQVSYTVNPVEVEYGYVEISRFDAILLGSKTSLKDVSVTLHTINGDETLVYLDDTNIIEDIDTSKSGYHTAKINYINEVEITYYVLDVSQITSIKPKAEFLAGGDAPTSFDAIITFEDGSSIEFEIANTHYENKKVIEILKFIDLSTAGTRNARVYFFGRTFDVEYTVVK